MERTFVVLCALAVALVFNSCDIDGDEQNFHFVSLRIVDVDMPESFELDETYRINVTFALPDGCTYFEGFDVTKEALTTRELVAIGSRRTDQDACVQTIREVEESFDFIVVHTEPYLFRFYQGEDANGDPQFIEFDVPVN
ncbi:hypothetical protein [Maribacter polysaccharolyticus]|uniref:hypothetical protein n=1 Tax=Maribacter polysaccharolyticus TaxID=3020831 RepID=UPI00237F78F4|nr:hypothetical protein [Maribacter polysaccharolyticus]MDE3742263.1 hypothetical protein [Maribacter polysaccharolyticus]